MTAAKPRVAVVYFRREQGGGCVWPPSSTEELARTQQLQNKIMQEAAARYGVDLSILSERVTDLNATLEQISQIEPDGLIAIGMDFDVVNLPGCIVVLVFLYEWVRNRCSCR